jgi:MFS family permease
MVLVRGGRRPARTDDDAEHQRGGLLGDISSGLAYAWHDSAVRSLVLLTAAFNFAFSGPISVGLPYLADHRFAGGAALFGIMLSTFGAGAVAGALLAGSMKHVARLGLVVLAIAFAMGVGLAIIGLSPNVFLTLAAGLGIGVGAGFINVRVIAWLQQRTPEALRGRVMSLVLLGAVGLQPIGLGVAGAIIDLGAVTLMFAVAGGIIVAATIAGWLGGLPGQMTDEAAA